MTKLHIENINIHIGGAKPSAMPHVALIAALEGLAERNKRKAPAFLSPKVGDKWPGTEAIYAGKSLSRDGSKIVDLIFWPDESNKERNFDDNKAWCESVSADTGSHAATRQQAIVINDNLRHLLSKDHWYWTETKTNSGEYAFVQSFNNGFQPSFSLGTGYRALAVSEIH